MTRIARPTMNVVPAARPVAAKAQAPAPARPVAASGVAKAVLTAPTTKNEIAFHVTPSESHRAILDSIKGARNSFYIETFIWHNDEAGNEIADALIAKKQEAAARGEKFDAKVLIDWLGLRNGSGGSDDTAIVEKMRQGVIEV
ncbi:MAG: phospholipase D-like domain-containing protein, partial [Candidatus Sericytochromatia bacterium]